MNQDDKRKTFQNSIMALFVIIIIGVFISLISGSIEPLFILPAFILGIIMIIGVLAVCLAIIGFCMNKLYNWVIKISCKIFPDKED